MIDVLNVILDDNAVMPTRAHASDAGLDLYTPNAFRIPAHSSSVVNTGVHVEIPNGYVGMIKSKSGLNVNKNITSEGVIDAGYTGSIVVKLYNHGDEPQEFAEKSKISQVVIMPVTTPDLKLVDEFKDTERGNNGFGSTGV